MWDAIAGALGGVDWGKIAGGAINAGVGMIGAGKQRGVMNDAAQASRTNPFNVNSPWGTINYDPRSGGANFNMAQNPFYNFFSAIGTGSLANAGTAPGSFLYGADPELANAYRGLTGPELDTAAKERYDVMNQIAMPEQQRAYNSLQDTLFAQGRLGTSGGGVQQEAFQNAANRAALERQLASQDWAASRARDRFQGAQQAVGSGQAGQRQQWGMGTEAMTGISNIWSNLLNAGRVAGNNEGLSPDMAMARAGARMAPWQAGYGALKEGGAFDWISKQLGNWAGGNQYGTPLPAIPGSVYGGSIDLPQIQPQPINIPQYDIRAF